MHEKADDERRGSSMFAGTLLIGVAGGSSEFHLAFHAMGGVVEDETGSVDDTSPCGTRSPGSSPRRDGHDRVSEIERGRA